MNLKTRTVPCVGSARKQYHIFFFSARTTQTVAIALSKRWAERAGTFRSYCQIQRCSSISSYSSTKPSDSERCSATLVYRRRARRGLDDPGNNKHRPAQQRAARAGHRRGQGSQRTQTTGPTTTGQRQMANTLRNWLITTPR